MKRAPIADLAAGERTLPEDVAHHLLRVLRLGVGDRFVAFDVERRIEADAIVLELEPPRVRIEGMRPASVVAPRELVLIYALAKGDKVDDVVRDATELGATRIIIARTERSVVKVSDEKAAEKQARWQRIAEQAARQCGRSDPPAIEGVFDWTAALDRATAEARFCLDPRAESTLGSKLDARVSTAFAIGPEGGLTTDEVGAATNRGWLPVSLGPFVLRTETVAAAVLGAVRVLSG
jgi:16S rRNA (uracil1498-N3)-methyltransferase